MSDLRIFADLAALERTPNGEPFFPKDRNYTSTRLGNKIVITGSQINEPQRLLEANIAELDQKRNYEAGAWVLTTSTQWTPGAGGVLQLNPIIGRLSFGDGSVTTPVEIDITNGATIQLPSGVAQLDAVLELPPPGTSPPAEQTITATIHRGFSSQVATRTFYGITAAGGGIVFGGRVPVGTKGVRVWGAVEDTANVANATLTFTPGGAGILWNYSQANMIAANNGGFRLGVPGGSLFWLLAVAADAAGPRPVSVEFEIGL